ncbi:prepilin-type N-terminal cleavage/methylation domain-containing protein [Candidatus Sumerlaeota bacterium]|nr:prepilin-type N-terminal cleavage/methylation domain-containing protein [Candidatus Sumerlaeota bacterium]MBI3736678.1 prepilin-type N-terminal cleavage/methylation domain-containing protein [Candidatus Sumerlaeota bacterium]
MNSRGLQFSKRTAFTFVELMIVLIIIATLAAIAVPNFLESKVRASVSRSKADLATLKMAIETYRLENHAYPRNRVTGVPDPYDLIVLTTPVAYLGSLPPDAMTTQEVRGAHHPRTMGLRPYNYFNAIQADPVAGLKVKSDEGFGDYGHIVGFIWGIGPALGIPGVVDPKFQPTKISPNGEADLIRYDPTNGSTSRGDIYEKLP